MKTTAVAILALAASSSAFAPVSQNSIPPSTQLNAESRREALGVIGAAFGGLVLPGIAGASNPALETFKGGKKTKGAFIPGKVCVLRIFVSDGDTTSNLTTAVLCLYSSYS